MKERSCPHCHNPISDGAIYCIDCGRRVDGKQSILESFSFDKTTGQIEERPPEQQEAPPPEFIPTPPPSLPAGDDIEILPNDPPSPPALPSDTMAPVEIEEGVQSLRYPTLKSAEPAAPAPDFDTDSLICPRCEIVLTPRDRDGLTLYECSQCGGAFADIHHSKRLQDVAAPDIPDNTPMEILKRRVKQFAIAEPIRYARCPVCRVMMRRYNLGNVSGVMLDQCWEHGTWFDAGEIEKMQAFIASGGLALSREQLKQHADYITRRRQANAEFDAQNASYGDSLYPRGSVSPGSSASSFLESLIRGLFD